MCAEVLFVILFRLLQCISNITFSLWLKCFWFFTEHCSFFYALHKLFNCWVSSQCYFYRPQILFLGHNPVKWETALMKRTTHLPQNATAFLLLQLPQLLITTITIVVIVIIPATIMVSNMLEIHYWAKLWKEDLLYLLWVVQIR